jgi:CMP-N,N'-diacetyllegionaminic acid synthase
VKTVVALVPATAKSQRGLAGERLIAYSMASAQAAGVFTDVVVAPRSDPEAEWILGVMQDRDEDAFALLRPASPFLRAATIRHAWERLLELGGRADCIRSVERCREHPAKMWTVEDELLRPVLERTSGGTPWHSLPYQALPEVWVESPCLEIAWRRALTTPTVRAAPFFVEGVEGFAIQCADDFARAKEMIERGEAELPQILEVVQPA